MPANRMQRYSRREFRRAVVEHHAMGEVEPYNAHDILDLERVREPRIAHVTAGGVCELRLLQMEGRGRKAVEVADVVVVEMRQDHVLNARAVDADESERLDRAAQERAAAHRGHLRPESRVDDERPLGPDRDPQEIVHRHGPVVRIAADEVIRTPRLPRRIADGEQLVMRQGILHHNILCRETGGLAPCSSPESRDPKRWTWSIRASSHETLAASWRTTLPPRTRRFSGDPPTRRQK